MTVRAVVFDIGNVLIRWNPEAYYDRLLGPAAARAFFAETGIHTANLAIDEGAPFRETILALAERHPAWADAIRRWHDDWGAFLEGEIAGTVALMRRLRAKGTPVFALTNFGEGPFAIASARHPFLGDFDAMFMSARLGLLKPDPRIYAAVEARSGLPPEALFFTDDKPENVAAAVARGWRGHVFATPGALAAALHDVGILTAREAEP